MAVKEPHMRSQNQINIRISTKVSNQGSQDVSSTTPNEDPLRILFPTQKKLSTIESQRILSVLDETVRRIAAALLIPSMLTSLDCLSVPLGSQLVKLLHEYREIAVRYEAVYETLTSLGITPMRAKKERKESSCSSIRSVRKSLAPIDEEVEKKFYSLEQCIHHSIKSITRVVGTNPALLQTVSKNKGATYVHSHLMESIRGLRSVLNERLLTTKVEEVKRKEHMLLVAEQRMNAEDQIRQLEKELQEAEKKKEEEVKHTNLSYTLHCEPIIIRIGFILLSEIDVLKIVATKFYLYTQIIILQVYKKKSQIKQLHADIKTVATIARDSNRRIKTEAERKNKQTKTTHTTVKTKLEEEISTLKKKLQDIVAENKEREQDMRKVDTF